MVNSSTNNSQQHLPPNPPVYMVPGHNVVPSKLINPPLPPNLPKTNTTTSLEQQRQKKKDQLNHVLESCLLTINQSIHTTLRQVTSQIQEEFDLDDDSELLSIGLSGIDRSVVLSNNRTIQNLEEEKKKLCERLTLQQLLCSKLQRHLVEEKLMAIDLRKEIEEIQMNKAAQNAQLDSGEAGKDKANSPLPPPKLNMSTSDVNLWHSPSKESNQNKNRGLMSYSSFYSSQQADEKQSHLDDQEKSPVMAPLRNSLMDKFLPSSLLDSPCGNQSGDNGMDYSSENEGEDEKSVKKIQCELESFVLNENRTNADAALCSECGVAAITNPDEIATLCRHRIEALLCVNCQQVHPEYSSEESQCIDCSKKDEENCTESGDQDKGNSNTLPAVSSQELSLLVDMFESVPAIELETILRKCGNETSTAIDYVLENHPIFNPALNSISALDKSKNNLNNVNNSNAAESQRSANMNGNQNNTSSNWKTEICMYYLQGKCNKSRKTCSFAHGEIDLVKVSKPAGINPSYKSRICPLYLAGNCPKSRRDCLFAHGESDLRTIEMNTSANANAILNNNMSNSNVTSQNNPNNNGNQNSGQSVNNVPRMQNYKTEMCYYYVKGCCNYKKEECRFAHGDADLRTVESNTMDWNPNSNNATSNIVNNAPPVPAIQMQQQQQQQQQQSQPQQGMNNINNPGQNPNYMDYLSTAERQFHQQQQFQYMMKSVEGHSRHPQNRMSLIPPQRESMSWGIPPMQYQPSKY